MDLTAVALALGSAVTHPLRELFIKRNPYPEALCIGVFMTWVVLAGLHALVLGLDFGSIASVWPFVLVSAAAIMLYHFFIVVALRTGDLSIYYPIARSYPLIILVIGVLFLGHRYAVEAIVGMGLVLAGAFFLQHRRDAHLISNKKALASVILAMLCSAAYSLSDASAIQSIHPAVFFFWDSLLVVPFGLAAFAMTRPPLRTWTNHYFGNWRTAPGGTVAAGITSYLSYALILFAYQAGGGVAAVNSIRQASVPLSIALSGMILKEKNIHRRMGWSMVLVAGIVMIVLAK